MKEMITKRMHLNKWINDLKSREIYKIYKCGNIYEISDSFYIYFENIIKIINFNKKIKYSLMQ